MTTPRNLGWLRDRLGRLLNFNEGQTNQDFTGPSADENKWMDEYLNAAYEFEVEEAVNNVGWRRFTRFYEFSWPAQQLTLELPRERWDTQFIEWRDVTDIETGSELDFHPLSIFAKDNKTYQWGDAGPGRTTTVRAFFIANARELEDKYDEPDLIPHQNRRLVVWKGGDIARAEADEETPSRWLKHIDDLRQQFHSSLSSGNPRINDPARIKIRGGFDF